MRALARPPSIGTVLPALLGAWLFGGAALAQSATDGAGPRPGETTSALPPAARAGAEDRLSPRGYTLGPQDKLRLRVFEWQTVKGEVREWPALSGSVVVGASGRLSLPFVGEIVAEGRTTEAVAREIGGKLQRTLGLPDRPQAAVEVEEHRPFFVAGRVRAPGAFAFRPGLTVLQAFTLAGGFPDAPAYGSRVSRDLINAAGNIEILQEERARLLVRRARISAETAGTDFKAPPLPDVAPEVVGRLAADERAIMEAQRTSLERETAALADLETLLEKEIAALAEKIVALERQVALANEERDGVRKLNKRGLAVRARVLAIERTVADMESRMLDMNTATLRAQQEIAKARQSVAGLQTAFAARVARDRLETEAQLGKVSTRLDLQHGLRDEALGYAATNVEREARVQPVFTIVRPIAGVSRRLPADESTALLPGDVLEVEAPPAPGGTLSGMPGAGVRFDAETDDAAASN